MMRDLLSRDLLAAMRPAPIAGALILAALPIAAQTAPPGARAGIETVIGDQITAMRSDDFVTAFTYASPGIHSIFRTPQNFGAMVQSDYPMVWHPAEVKYLGLRQENGAQVERIMTVDGSGMAWFLDYRMVQVNGAWRIDGVWLVPGHSAGV